MGLSLRAAPARPSGKGLSDVGDFEAMYRANVAAIYRFCLMQLREPMLAEDAAADVFTSPSLTGEGVAETPQQRLHHSLGIVGFDDRGDPVIELGSADALSLSATLLVAGPQDAHSIVAAGQNDTGHLVPFNAVGGAAAVWMVAAGGTVAVYEGPGTISRVGRVPVPPGGEAQLAGTCG